jgi:AraC-like DNA-binding protein
MDSKEGCLPAADLAAARRAAVERAIVVMRAGLASPQPLVALAKCGMFSPFYFHRMFREVTGVTPARFLAALRMAEARRLLVYSRISVRRIGERVGYTSPGTFGTQFGRLVGLPPARFRALVHSRGDQRVGALLSEVAAVPAKPVGATMALSGVPVAEALVIERFQPADGSARARLSVLCIGSGESPTRAVPLPDLPGPGGYAVRTVVVPAGVRLADVLVDSPRSYLVGLARIRVTAGDRAAPEVHTILRWPELTDPPASALTPLDWLVQCGE